MRDGSHKAREYSLLQRVDQLRTELAKQDPELLARNVGATYDHGVMHFTVWQEPVRVPRSDFIAVDERTRERCDGLTQALIAYHLTTADGTVPTGKWIGFSELPDGQFYASAFQSYTGTRLAQQFADNAEVFRAASHNSGGREIALADIAMRFQVLPFVPVAVVCWLGDEDFATSYRLLFDASVGNLLPTDACAIVGSILVGKLCSAQAIDTLTDQV